MFDGLCLLLVFPEHPTEGHEGHDGGGARPQAASLQEVRNPKPSWGSRIHFALLLRTHRMPGAISGIRDY